MDAVENDQRVSVLQGKLQVPHSLALDTCANAIYVADRGASAVRRFNIAGEFAGVNHWDVQSPRHVHQLHPIGGLLRTERSSICKYVIALLASSAASFWQLIVVLFIMKHHAASNRHQCFS